MLQTEQRSALHQSAALLVALSAADRVRPLPGWKATARQQQAIDSPADELLYGGAAGGGKSEFLLALARQCHRSVLALRRTFSSLDRNLIPRARNLFASEVRAYNASAHRWTFTDGTRLVFGHMQNGNDFDQYRSDEYDLIAWDELTEFDRVQYEFMFSRLRTTATGQRVRMVATTNPGGVGEEWVAERWAAWLNPLHPHPAAPGELRWYARAGGKEVEVPGPEPVMLEGTSVQPLSRTFIPALVGDNPHLGADYAARLQSLPEPFRSQMLHGDWQIGLRDDADAVIPRAWLRAAMARWKPLEAPLPLTALGVDIARGGEDSTAVAVRRQHHVEALRMTPGRQTPTGRAAVACFRDLLTEGGLAAVDSIGVGGAALDAANDEGLAVVPVNFGAGTDERDGSGVYLFANVRAWAYWNLRQLLDPERPMDEGELPLELPDDSELFAELAAPRFSLTGSGRIKLESKDEIKSRLGRSPDKADAVVLAFTFNKQFDPAEYARQLKDTNPHEYA